MRVKLLLAIVFLASTSGIVAAYDFPPFCEPTALDRTFLVGERVDFAFQAADQLQAAGFARDAQRVRGAFVLWRQPMHQVIRIENAPEAPKVQLLVPATKPR